MSWRVARALDKLLAQINAYAPNRSKISDGSIGDTAHSSRVSDHNPDSRGVVHARDFTHSPATGFDAHAFVRRLAKPGDRRIRYLISNRQISNPSIGGGRWRPYSGINPHTHHAHVSCVYGSLEDNTANWPGLVSAGGAVVTPSTSAAPPEPKEFFGMTVYNKGSHYPNLSLTPGKWRQIRIGKNAYSIATVKKGAETYTVLTFRLEGLPKPPPRRAPRLRSGSWNSTARRATTRFTPGSLSPRSSAPTRSDSSTSTRHRSDPSWPRPPSCRS